MTKIYECCICHRILTKSRPIRLVKQLYGKGNYKQYAYDSKYDFCTDCYRKFDAWIYKHSREVSNG